MLFRSDYATIELDSIVVAGRDTPVRVYTVLGPPSVAMDPDFRRLETLNARMLLAYRGQDWAEAACLAEQCKALDDGRLAGFYELYQTRISDLRRNPPPPGWSGFYVATTK